MSQGFKSPFVGTCTWGNAKGQLWVLSTASPIHRETGRQQWTYKSEFHSALIYVKVGRQVVNAQGQGATVAYLVYDRDMSLRCDRCEVA